VIGDELVDDVRPGGVVVVDSVEEHLFGIDHQPPAVRYTSQRRR